MLDAYPHAHFQVLMSLWKRRGLRCTMCPFKPRQGPTPRCHSPSPLPFHTPHRPARTHRRIRCHEPAAPEMAQVAWAAGCAVWNGGGHKRIRRFCRQCCFLPDSLRPPTFRSQHPPPSTSAPHPAGPPQVPHRPRRIRAGPDPGVDAFQAGFFPCGWTAGGPARGSALPAPDRPRCPVLPRHRPVQARRIAADRPDFHKIF